MKYFCRSCETIHKSLHEVLEPFDHNSGVDCIRSLYCPNCKSQFWKEIEDHGYLVKTSKTTKIIYSDDDLIDWIHTLGKCKIEEF